MRGADVNVRAFWDKRCFEDIRNTLRKRIAD